MKAPRLYFRNPPKQVKPRHVKGAIALFAIWYFVLVISDHYNLTASIFLLHPINHFSVFLFFPLVSAWAAWNLRDGRKDNELTLQLLSVNYSFVLAVSSAPGNFTQKTLNDYIKNVNDYMNAVDRHLKSDSKMYAVSLLFGTYSTLCLAKAAIEKLGP